jgi:type II secretory pathway pseudopilin PulG
LVAEYRKEIGVTAPELLVVVAVLMGIFGIMLSIYGTQVRRANEGILTAQLRAMRAQARVFRVLSGNWPDDTKELVNSRLSLFPLGALDLEEAPVSKILEDEPVIAYAVDDMGYPVDPWGNRYAYDPVTGKIISSMEKYADW